MSANTVPLPGAQQSILAEALAPYRGVDVADLRNTHLVAPGTDRHTVPSPNLLPYPTMITVNPDPDAGEVFKAGSKPAKKGQSQGQGDDEEGGWVDMLSLSAPTLNKFANAAGVFWLPHLCRATKVERNYICYEAVGYVVLPDGSRQILKGTREIDLLDIEAESQTLQSRKLWKDRRCQERNVKYGKLKYNEKRALDEEAKAIDFDDLGPEDQKRVERAVQMELREFRKHKHARAETGAKKRAIASLGIKLTYTAEELKKPFLFVRWGLNPASDRGQWELKALWGEVKGPAPVDAGAQDFEGRMAEGTEFVEDEGPGVEVGEVLKSQGEEAEEVDHDDERPADGLVTMAWCEHLELVLGLNPRRRQELRIHHAKTQKIDEATPEQLDTYYAWLLGQLPKT